MVYRTAAIPMTFSDFQGHFSIANLFKWVFFVQLCSTWQDFNWHCTSRGTSATAELLVASFWLLHVLWPHWPVCYYLLLFHCFFCTCNFFCEKNCV